MEEGASLKLVWVWITDELQWGFREKKHQTGECLALQDLVQLWPQVSCRGKNLREIQKCSNVCFTCWHIILTQLRMSASRGSICPPKVCEFFNSTSSVTWSPSWPTVAPLWLQHYPLAVDPWPTSWLAHRPLRSEVISVNKLVTHSSGHTNLCLFFLFRMKGSWRTMTLTWSCPTGTSASPMVTSPSALMPWGATPLLEPLVPHLKIWTEN